MKNLLNKTKQFILKKSEDQTLIERLLTRAILLLFLPIIILSALILEAYQDNFKNHKNIKLFLFEILISPFKSILIAIVFYPLLIIDSIYRFIKEIKYIIKKQNTLSTELKTNEN
jgi:hypothetical protein